MLIPTDIQDIAEGVYPVPFLNSNYAIIRALLQMALAGVGGGSGNGGAVTLDTLSNGATKPPNDPTATAAVTGEGDIELLPKPGQKIRLFPEYRLTDEQVPVSTGPRALTLRQATTGVYRNYRGADFFFGDDPTPLSARLSIYDVSGGAIGKPAASAVIARFQTARAFTLPVGLAGSVATCEIAPTTATVFSIRKNGVQFGTLTVAAGATTGTFAATSATAFAAGNKLTVVAPSPADATLSDVSFTIAGVLS